MTTVHARNAKRERMERKVGMPIARDCREEGRYLGVNEATPCTEAKCAYFYDKLPNHCILETAKEGPMTLEEIGKMLEITRERVRQIEKAAMEKIRRRAWFLARWIIEEPASKSRQKYF